MDETNETNELEEPLAMRATVSYDDGQVRVTLLNRVGKERFAEIAEATGLNWRRAEQALAGPWSPWLEDRLRDRYGVELEPEEIDLRQVAAGRAEHYQQWGDNAAARRDAAAVAQDAILSRIPMGQPVQVGHHSEGRHRRDLARADGHMHRMVEEGERAEKWDGRAEQTVRHATRRYAAEALARRISELEAELRRKQRAVDEYAGKLQAEPDNRQHAAGRSWAAHWVVFLTLRLERARELLAEAETAAGGDVAGSVAARLALPVEVGGGVSINAADDPRGGDTGWYEVVRVNRRTITISGWLGIRSLEWKLKMERIKQAMPRAEWAGVEKVAYGAGLRIRRPEGATESES